MKDSEHLIAPYSRTEKRSFIYNLLISLLLASILLSGFITNFLSFSKTSLGTVLIDFLIFLLLLHLSIKLVAGSLKGLKVNRVYFSFLTFWVLLLILTMLKLIVLDATPLTERLLGVRNNLLYMVPLIYIPLFFKKENDIESLISLLFKLSLLLVFFSIIQFTFSSWLPESLLVLRGEDIFSFYGTTIARPTALLGNTIIFASFTLIIFSLYFAKYLYHKKRSYGIILLIIGLANFLTFTRATIVGLVIVMLVSLFLRYGRFSLSFIVRITSVLVLIFMIALAGLYFYRDSFLVERLTGNEASTRGSTNVHIIQIKNSINYLKENYIVGAGVGSQGASGNPAKKIITDGYWFQVLLENGIPLGLLYIAFHTSCVFFALRTFYRNNNLLLKQLCMAFVAFSAYFYSASFLNSGFAGRANYIIYWLLFGILLAQFLIVKRKSYAIFSH